MLHIDSTKLHQWSFWGETLRSHNNPWDDHRGMWIWPPAKHGHIAMFCLSKDYIVVSQCVPQPMPPPKSYTAPHKNLIFLISFPCCVQVCNISTKAAVSFFGLNTEGNDWITSSVSVSFQLVLISRTFRRQSQHLLSVKRLKTCSCTAW